MATEATEVEVGTDDSPPAYLRRPHDNPTSWILRKLWDRLNDQSEHFILALVGREGSGKSQTSLRIADEIDQEFDVDKVIFDVADLLRKLRDGELSRGEVVVLDEAGVSLGRRTWQDRGQVLANQALQLIRSHGVGLIFTLPRLSELDSQAIGRLQAFYEITDKVDGEYVEGKWKWLDPDRADQSGEVYHKYPRWRRDGRVERITRIAVKPPRDALVEPYTERKSAHQEQFYQEALAELEGEDDDAEDDPGPKDIAQEILDDVGPSAYIRAVNSGTQKILDKDAIAAEFDISARAAKQVKSLLLREVDENVM